MAIEVAIPGEIEWALVSTSDTLGGSVRFKGTRVPVRALLDAIACGRNVDYFLDAYPGVTREQAAAVIRWEQNRSRATLRVELIE